MLDDALAAFSPHSDQKTMIFLSLSFVWLECSLHFLSYRARSMLINLFLSVKLEFPFKTK
jgi:hypothetical protein